MYMFQLQWNWRIWNTANTRIYSKQNLLLKQFHTFTNLTQNPSPSLSMPYQHLALLESNGSIQANSSYVNRFQISNILQVKTLKKTLIHFAYVAEPDAKKVAGSPPAGPPRQPPQAMVPGLAGGVFTEDIKVPDKMVGLSGYFGQMFIIFSYYFVFCFNAELIFNCPVCICVCRINKTEHKIVTVSL